MKPCRGAYASGRVLLLSGTSVNVNFIDIETIVFYNKLVGYNGATLSYDAIGNLTSDGTWTYTWEKGRQLKQMSKSGTTIQFKYDHNGIRTQKIATVNGATTTTNYVYNGKKLVHLTQGNNWMHFYYDGQGNPAMVNYNGTLYTYVKNLQSDIIGILYSAGDILVEYKYDAWGRVYSTSGISANTVGLLNPHRYRGYVYDEESQLYYLIARYYSTKLHRFISVDSIITHNQYSYCANSPIVLIDPDGKMWQGAIHRAVQYDICMHYPGMIMEVNVDKITGGMVELILQIHILAIVGKSNLVNIINRVVHNLLVIFAVLLLMIDGDTVRVLKEVTILTEVLLNLKAI